MYFQENTLSDKDQRSDLSCEKF